MTQLVPMSDSLAKLLADPKVDLEDVLTQMAVEAHEPPTEAPKRRPVPSVPAVSTETRKSLRTVVKRVEEFDFPTEARQLSEDERREAIQIYIQIKDAAKALTKFEETFKATFHTHMDLVLEAEGVAADIEQDKNDHYVKFGVVSAPGLPQQIVREERGGKAAAVTITDLENLERQGLIDHKTLLGLTEAVPATRRPAPAKILEAVRRDPSLLLTLRTLAKLTGKSTAINVRDVKAV